MDWIIFSPLSERRPPWQTMLYVVITMQASDAGGRGSFTPDVNNFTFWGYF
jgi:hypothetical protein